MASRKLQRTKRNQYSIVLPAATVEPLGWKPGQQIEMVIAGKDSLLLRPITGTA